MGKGDKKSKRGKIASGSYGVRRPRKKNKPATSVKKKAVKKAPAKAKAAPEKTTKAKAKAPAKAKPKTTAKKATKKKASNEEE